MYFINLGYNFLSFPSVFSFAMGEGTIQIRNSSSLNLKMRLTRCIFVL